jgi:superfamily I DNA and/or RNA helicase
VAVTRPRHFLIVIGNAATLSKDKVWNSLIEFSKSKGKFMQISRDLVYDKSKTPPNGI